MKPFGWWIRAWYASVAGLAGWFSGFLITTPFEISLAWRYVDGRPGKLPWALAEGLVVWAAFTAFMALAAWLPLILPVALLLPPGWAVRWRKILVPLGGVAGVLGIGLRLRILTREYLTDFSAFRSVFFTSQVIFAVTFAVVVTAVYCAFAKRRLGEPPCN